MAGRDPLLPNAWVVARREFRDRVRGPLYLASTIVLAGLAMLVAMAPSRCGTWTGRRSA